MSLETLCYDHILHLRKESNRTRFLAVGIFSGISVGARIFRGYKTEGGENIPKEGAALLVLNHKDEEDPMKITVAMIESARRIPSFVTRDTLIDPNLQELKVVVDRNSKNEKTNLEAASSSFKVVRGVVIKGCGAIPIRRGKPDRSFFNSLKQVIEKERAIVGIFAQESRHGDGGLADIFSGPAFIAHRYPDIPIVPGGISEENGVNLVRFGQSFTYNQSLHDPRFDHLVGKRLGMKLFIGDRIAELLPRDKQEDWQQTHRPALMAKIG